jgi:hypothetical protein
MLDGDTSGGWSDLETARQVAGDSEDVLTARQELIAHTLGQAESLIASGDLTGGAMMLERLEKKNVQRHQVAQLKEVVRRLESARKLARRGRFADALQQIESARELRADWDVLQKWQEDFLGQAQRCQELTEKLHRCVAQQQWTDAVRVADDLICLAPDNRLARDVRKRAWQEVGTRIVDSQRPAETQYWAFTQQRSTDNGNHQAVGQPSASRGGRFQLWVDGVGGFLVCLGDEVTLGQSTLGNRVDIPIQADLSRVHATIRRRGEGYLIDPHLAVSLDGRRILETSLLSDGDEIELGHGVRLRYRQPHALSGTARLDFLSSHRTKPRCDAILLMAESCVLGPQWNNHVVCRDWSEDVVLFRQDGQLNCRAMQAFEIDGRLCDGRGPVGLNSHIAGDDFSLSLEEIVGSPR